MVLRLMQYEAMQVKIQQHIMLRLHNEWQPIIGYGWEKGWYLDSSRDFRLGLGVTAGITAREDFANYVPLPIILPLFSASYRRLSVQFTYIPGTYNNGNVLFAWLRYGF